MASDVEARVAYVKDKARISKKVRPAIFDEMTELIKVW